MVTRKRGSGALPCRMRQSAPAEWKISIGITAVELKPSSSNTTVTSRTAGPKPVLPSAIGRLRVDDPRDLGDPGGREAGELGVLMDRGLVLSHVEAERLVLRDEGLHPLHLGR